MTPRFKSRRRDGIGGFRLTGSIRVKREGKRAYVRLPRIGRVRLSEPDRLPEGALAQVSVREKAGHWYVSAQVPAAVTTKYAGRQRRAAPEGVDLGVSALVTLSDGSKVPAPKHLRASLRKLRRLEREKSRRRLGSKNRQKTVARLARAHERVANQRRDMLHKLTTMLATTRAGIVIEDLNAQGMSKNHALALSVLDAGFYELRRQLQYKCEWHGCGLELAPRYYPSTQTCSDCGLVKTGNDQLSLSQRVFRCHGCGLVLDRDENAARVLASLYGSKHTLKARRRELRGDAKRLWSGKR